MIFKRFRKNSIAKISFLSTMGIVTFSILIVGFLWIGSLYEDFRKDLDKFKEFYIEEKKIILKNEVENIVDYIKYEMLKTSKKDTHLSKEELKRVVLNETLDRVAELRFDKGGYFFIFNPDGTSLVFDGKRQNIDTKNIDGANEIVEKILDIAKNQKSGFLEYKWYTLEDKQNRYNKISYVKYCSHFDIIVGAGIYLTEINSALLARDEELKRDLKFYILHISVILFIIIFITFVIFNLLRNIIEDKIDSFVHFFKHLEMENTKIDKSELYFDEFKTLADSANNMAIKRETLELELKQQKDFLSKVIDSSSNSIYVRDKSNRFVLVNSSLANIIGSDKDELIGKSVEEFLPLKCIDNIDYISDGLMRFKEREIWFEVNEVSLDESLFLVTLNDVTIRKNFETLLQIEIKRKKYELMEQRADYKMMLDVLPMSILYKDTNNTILRANRNLIEILNTTESEIEGRCARDVFCDDSIYSDDLEIINSRKPKFNIIQKLKIGDEIYQFEVSKFPIIKNDDVKGILITMLDITQRVKLELENNRQSKILIQQSKMAAMGEMIGVIAHQWKQPLNGIYLLLQSLQSDLDIDGVISKEIASESFFEIREQIDFLFETMNEFRDFFKPSKEKKLFSIINSIDDILIILKAQFLKYHIEIKIDVPDFDCNYFGYENEFKQVMLNIFNNSKDALMGKKNILNSDDLPLIEIYFEQDSEYISIFIEDNAGGIDDSIIDMIFDSYFTTKGDSGTGIGLYLAKMIIENMGGKIEVFNGDSGACFKVSLKKSLPIRSE